MPLKTFGNLGISEFLVETDVIPDRHIANFYRAPETTPHENAEDLKVSEAPSQRLVRTTKTRTQSRILGNGDMIEQTVVKEVTETVTTSLCQKETCEECDARCQREKEDVEKEKAVSQRGGERTGLVSPYTRLGRTIHQY